jgi:hypothetical protein
MNGGVINVGSACKTLGEMLREVRAKQEVGNKILIEPIL